MNRNTLWGTFAVILLLGLAVLVSKQEASSISPLNQSATAPKLMVSQSDQLNQLVNANNHFGFALFAQLQPQKSQPQNIFISPQSIAIALAMTRNGTGRTTQAEMTQVLGLEQFDAATVNASYAELIKTLNSADGDLELAIANSLWVNQNISLKQQFIKTTQDFYQGSLTNLDFSNPSAKNKINQWVASKTANQIPEIVDSISPEDALYLINAIYFKGNWTNKFDPNATTEQPFYLDSNQTKPVAMMSQTGDYRYYENEQFQAIRLPYGKQGQLGMYIFLPQKNSSLKQFNQQLNLANWQEWLKQMRSQSGNISLPKFKLEYDTELKDVLSSLGMQQAFNFAQADFSAMTDSAVAINTVKHKAVIEVNEEGTEAAGVTSTGIRITSIPQQPFNMNIDRPFFCAIGDDSTETLLFMGNVVNPQQN
ncbi:proteinase inhibitor I4 serpin [Pleurocapsa sp. CCALA 161]|uniref:serpin family protein n=1 Tax=Pleurocapsa sp. CCALA 161 TaxID=2107688 RepID=UPI000D06C22D|nr:serpin family protein [Pleurocapsa sp. CCALA 161]PSB12399.1 proteinase inhibitor I4 serpin [Pleurocapsa sp. CCALA 161]